MSRSRRSAAQPPEFFCDRSLGKIVARELRARGWTVHLIAEYYDNDAQHVLDEEWIAAGTAQGWHMLTKDAAIKRRDHEAIAVGHGMLFTLARQDLRASDMVELLERHRSRIHRLIAAGQPGIYVISQSEVKKYTRPTCVHGRGKVPTDGQMRSPLVAK